MEFAGVEISELLGGFDEGQAAIASGGHCTHQIFIKAIPDSKGAGADATLAETLHMGCDLLCITDAVIRTTIGEQQHAIERGWIEMVGHLGGTGYPAIKESGATTAVDGVDGSDEWSCARNGDD